MPALQNMKTRNDRTECIDKQSAQYSTPPTHCTEWPSHSPDLNQLENLWQDLKIAVYRHSPFNQTKLELFCKEEWENISVSICASLVETHPKTLAAVIAAKGGSTKY